MAQLQVIVNKLNIRESPVPDLADKRNVVGVLHKDAVFESVGEITNELGTWHVDKDGHWVWEKGVNEIAPPIIATITFPASETNSAWLNLLGIAEIWKITKGQSANVAILDSGIDLNNADITTHLYQYATDLKINDVKVCKNFITGTSDVTDLFNHGSHCASLISCANTKNLIGVAPESKLFIGKIDNTGGFDDFKIFADAIIWASNIEEIDIISISNGLSDPNQEDKTLPILKAALDFAALKNKIVIAAIGDKANDPNPLYPALYEKCISVGATDSTGACWDGNAESPLTTIYAPGVTVFSNSNNGELISLSGNSQAAAIVAGITALIVSHLKSKNVKYTTEYISEIITKYSGAASNNNSKILISPLKIFSNI